MGSLKLLHGVPQELSLEKSHDMSVMALVSHAVMGPYVTTAALASSAHALTAFWRSDFVVKT